MALVPLAVGGGGGRGRRGRRGAGRPPVAAGAPPVSAGEVAAGAPPVAAGGAGGGFGTFWLPCRVGLIDWAAFAFVFR